MAATRPLSSVSLPAKAEHSSPDTHAEHGARIIDLSDYFTKLGSGLKQREAHQSSAPKMQDTHRLQAKAVRFFQGQQELSLTNKH
jgi:hypothetical protein